MRSTPALALRMGARLLSARRVHLLSGAFSVLVCAWAFQASASPHAAQPVHPDAGTARSTADAGPDETSPRDKVRAQFEEFWKTFRSAVERGDNAAVADLTRFPLETRGVDDEDPVRKHDRKAFLEMLDRMLAQDSGIDVNFKSMRQLIVSTERLGDRDVVGKWANCADFQFFATARGWRLTRVYVDEHVLTQHQ